MLVEDLIRILQEFDSDVEVKIMMNDTPAFIGGLCVDEDYIYLYGDSEDESTVLQFTFGW